MEKYRTIYIVFLAMLLALPSCVSDDVRETPPTADRSRIFFRSYLPGVGMSRGSVISNEDFSECQVTCFNPEDSTLIDSDTGEITPYFSNMRFVRDPEDDTRYISDSDMCLWPLTRSKLHFMAFHPDTAALRKTNDTLRLANRSVSKDGVTAIDYRIENFRAAPEIADQIDFLAAYSTASQDETGDEGIKLEFEHRLARVELSAWSDSKIYDVEIAGVRIGNALTEGDFRFGETCGWVNTSQGVVEHIFTAGETIITLDDKADSKSKDKAVSIMGTAGPAMLIPMAEKIQAWEGKEDPKINDPDYTTDRLYFSVLLRVESRIEGPVFPYADYTYDTPARGRTSRASLPFPTVWLAVVEDGEVKARVYEADGKYYTSEKKDEEYELQEDEEIRGYSWAAIPVGAKWDAGKVYAYTLNYTDGVGWHDPSSPEPGRSIVDRHVGVTVDVTDWEEGSKSEVTVPRK